MSQDKVTKKLWVEMFEAIGLEEATMQRWHVEFERRSPEGHQSFLEWLAIPAEEIQQIRSHSRS